MAFHPHACDSVRENGRGYRLRWTHTVHTAEHSSGRQGSSQHLSRLHCLNFDSHLTAPPVGMFSSSVKCCTQTFHNIHYYSKSTPWEQRHGRIKSYPCHSVHMKSLPSHSFAAQGRLITKIHFVPGFFFSWGLWIHKCLSQCLSTLILIQLIRKS